MGSRIPTGHKMLQLALDIGQQRAGPEAEQVGTQPAVAQFVLHQRQPVERIPCGPDAARRLEAHQLAGALAILADGARHHQPDRERRVHTLLAGQSPQSFAVAGDGRFQ